MMDLKEIIKWFIPCFHILLQLKKLKMDTRLILLFIFMFLNYSPVSGAKIVSDSVQNSFNGNKLLVDFNSDLVSGKLNQSEYNGASLLNSRTNHAVADVSTGRTFGRPFKKMMAGLLPVVFQLGMAATWAVVAAVVGVKTLAVTLVILKLLLLAGALKMGALLGNKGHQSHGWEPHQKEIHLHIHNGQHPVEHEEHVNYGSWNREGTVSAQAASKHINVVLDPHPVYTSGPQTISTPYGHYVRVMESPPVANLAHMQPHT